MTAVVVARLLGWRSSGLLLAVFVSVPLIIFGALLPEPAHMAFIAENGVIESLTIVVYGALILALFAVSRDDRTFFIASAGMVALMAARELDLHKAFTTGSVLKLRTYTGDIPLMEKLIAGAVVIGLALFLIWYVVRYAGRLRRGIRLGDAAAYSVLTAAGLLVLAKVMDMFARVFRDLTGVTIDTGTALQLPEEVFELVAPVVLLWAVMQYVAQRPPGRGSRPLA